MSKKTIDSLKTTSPSEFVINRSNQPQLQTPISALLKDRREDNNIIINKPVAVFLPTPITPVAGASSSTLLRNSFEKNSPTITSLTLGTEKQKPYACTECNQTFSRPHNLKSHLTTHSSERPFQCSICNSFFRRHHDLKRHKKLHTGERPYRCNVCYRSFARLDALNRHCRAEGGTACNNAVTKQHQDQQHQQQRPIVPQLHIAHPASQPLPSIFHRHYHHSSPPIPPSPPKHTTTDTTAPTTITTSKHASSSTAARALLLPPFKNPWEENSKLRHELTYWKTKADQTNRMQSQLDNLQVENKVLRSIIMDARPDNTLKHG